MHFFSRYGTLALRERENPRDRNDSPGPEQSFLVFPLSFSSSPFYIRSRSSHSAPCFFFVPAFLLFIFRRLPIRAARFFMRPIVVVGADALKLLFALGLRLYVPNFHYSSVCSRRHRELQRSGVTHRSPIGSRALKLRRGGSRASRGRRCDAAGASPCVYKIRLGRFAYYSDKPPGVKCSMSRTANSR